MRRRRLLWIAVILVSTLLALGSTPGSCSDPEYELQKYEGFDWSYIPQWSPNEQQILIGDLDELYSVDVLTGTVRQLSARTDVSEQDYSPDVAPDGTGIAYSTLRFRTGGQHNFDIVTSTLDGRDIRRLTEHESDDVSPSWSPDGTRIAFLSNRNNGFGDFRLYTMAPDGSDVKGIASGITLWESPAVWSNDGQLLAFYGGVIVGATYSRIGLYIARADGAGEILFYPVTLEEEGANYLPWRRALPPVWSPNNTQVAFTAPEGGVYVADIDSTAPQQNLVYERRPSGLFWSPSEELLFYDSRAVWAVPADGSAPYERWVTEDPQVSLAFLHGGGPLDMSLSPDGSRIAAYKRHSSRYPTLGVISLDGSVVELIGEEDWPDLNLEPR